MTDNQPASRRAQIMTTLVWWLLKLVAALPLGVSQRLGRLVGWLHLRFNSRAARTTAANITACLPDLDESARADLIRASLVHTAQMMWETPAVWLGNLPRIEKWITQVENEHLLVEAQARDKGVIILLPHFGNWELLNTFFAGRQSITALYHPPDQVWLQPIMAKIRENFGNELVPTNVKGIARLYRCLAEKRVVAILPDQVPASGDYATFFGQTALTDRLVSRMLNKTGARALVCSISRQPRSKGFTVRFDEPSPGVYSRDLAESIQAVNDTVETCVRRDLGQYQWEYKRFRRRPEGMETLY